MLAPRVRTLVVLVCLSPLGCGAALAAAREAPTCHTWIHGPTGNLIAAVGKRATVHGLMGDVSAAQWTSDTTMVFPGMIGNVHATYVPPILTIHGLLGNMTAQLDEHGATARGLLGSIRVESNGRCTERQIALGAMSLLVVASS